MCRFQKKRKQGKDFRGQRKYPEISEMVCGFFVFSQKKKQLNCDQIKSFGECDGDTNRSHVCFVFPRNPFMQISFFSNKPRAPHQRLTKKTHTLTPQKLFRRRKK